jgi:eukaryotic translation initiation factor 2C
MVTGGPLRVAALVGVKRHHTRFYPMTDEDKDKHGNQNCKPGTWVDRGVTSPYYRDFYLQSHSGIKGTARPTHYFTLVNDGISSCKTTDDLRKLVCFSTPLHSICCFFHLSIDCHLLHD